MPGGQRRSLCSVLVMPRPQALTWCQFCMERLILGTEPGCSLFMSLGQGTHGEPPLVQGNLRDVRDSFYTWSHLCLP